MKSCPSGPVCFIGDVHLDDQVPERIGEFKRLLFEVLPAFGCRDLYLLGDIFHIWYRDQTLSKRYGDEILDILADFVRVGNNLEFVVGNRDFALCFDSTRQFPFPVHATGIERTIGPRRFFLCHGDELNRKDMTYRILHSIIRQRLPMAMFHALGTKTKAALVGLLMNMTHEATARKPNWKTQPYWPYVEQLVDGGIDVCVQGHKHDRCYRQLESSQREGQHFIVPRWLDHPCGLIYSPKQDHFAFFDF